MYNNTSTLSSVIDNVPNPYVHGFYMFLLSLISACGILLNILLLVIIHESHTNIKRRTILIINTSIADLVMVVSFPIDIWYSFNIGNTGNLCAAFLTLKLAPLYVALTSLTLLSIERLFIISKMLAPVPTTTYKYQVAGAICSWVFFIPLLTFRFFVPSGTTPICVFQDVQMQALLTIFFLELLGILISYLASVALIYVFRKDARKNHLRHTRNPITNRRNRRGHRVTNLSVDSGQNTGEATSPYADAGHNPQPIDIFTVPTTPPPDSSLRYDKIIALGNPETAGTSAMSSSQRKRMNHLTFTDSNNSLTLPQVKFNSRPLSNPHKKLDAISANIIKRTGVFVISFFCCCSPTFLVVGIYREFNLTYPYSNYIFWYLPLCLYAHVTLYPFIALFVDSYWRPRVLTKLTKVRKFFCHN